MAINAAVVLAAAALTLLLPRRAAARRRAVRRSREPGPGQDGVMTTLRAEFSAALAKTS